MLLDKCVCGETKGTEFIRNSVTYLVCSQCGLKRQILNTTSPKEIDAFYREKYHKGVYTHSYKEDMDAARSRLSSYELPINHATLLDVGCGNGAFLSVLRETYISKGVRGVGCDPGFDSNMAKGLDVYQDSLIDVHFPSDHFDVLTCHDVVEHSIDPFVFLQEMLRVLKECGKAYIEVPNFSFAHHWKRFEHLWAFSKRQFQTLLEKVGFVVESSYVPIDSKWVFVCSKPSFLRKTILVPPGVGDIIWSIAKLPGFLKNKGIDHVPHMYVASLNGGTKHSIPFVQRIPMVHAEGYANIRSDNKIWRESYFEDGKTVFEKCFGCDYFLAWNGALRHGKSIEEVDPEFGCDWNFPMFVSSYERKKEDEYRNKFGKYIAVHFINKGPYSKWVSEFPHDQMVESLKQFVASGYHVVLYGAVYDRLKSIGLLNSVKGVFNLIGKTKLEETFALLRGAEGVFGFPTGVTMLPVLWDKPTVLLWHEYFRNAFWWNALPSAAREETYMAIPTNGNNGKGAAAVLLGMLK